MWSSFPYPLSLVTALAIAALGAYATLANSHRRFRADVLSANRQRWIDSVRDRLSELLSVMSAAQVIKRAAADRWCGGAGPMNGNPALVEKIEKTYLAIAQIRLLTTAVHPQHKALNKAVMTAVSYIQDDDLHEAEVAACWDEIIELGRGIIREEWGRVKRGV